MSHIACMCGNDVRENNPDVEHNFVSLALMAAHEKDGAFFGLPYGKGKKAEIWICNECGRAIFFDDGGNSVTKIMRPEKPHPISMGASALVGYFYNEEWFFDEVDEYLTSESETGRRPDYEFFDERNADGAPLLTSSVMNETVFKNSDRIFENWWWATLSEDYLAVYDKRPAEGDTPMKLWIRGTQDEERLHHNSSHSLTACEAMRDRDVMGLDPGKPNGAPFNEYDTVASNER